jgi:hypothetical protein
MLELWLVPPKHTGGLKTLANGGNKAFRKFNKLHISLFSPGMQIFVLQPMTAEETNYKMSALVSGPVRKDDQIQCNYVPLVTAKLLYCESV